VDRYRAPSRAARSIGAVLLVAGLLVAACGGAPTASPPPSLAAGPTTPPKLPDPTSAADVFRGLREAGITLVGIGASAGQTPSDPVERISATLDNQPLAILGYASDLGRAKLYPFRDGTAPDANQPVYTFAATNIVIEFGPSAVGKKPPAPNAALSTLAQRLATTLQALLGQLAERSVQRASAAAPAATPTAPVTLAPATAPPSSR
jgi:hypothetical protein